MARDSEADIHIWAKPETEAMVALFTISHGPITPGARKYSICVDLPEADALAALATFMQQMVA